MTSSGCATFTHRWTSSGQLGAVVSDVLRSKAADLLTERVKVADESGRNVVVGGADADSGASDGAEEPGDAAETAEAVEGEAGEGEAAEPEASLAPAKGRSGKRAASRAEAQEDQQAKPKARGRRSRKDTGQPETEKSEAAAEAE